MEGAWYLSEACMLRIQSDMLAYECVAVLDNEVDSYTANGGSEWEKPGLYFRNTMIRLLRELGENVGKKPRDLVWRSAIARALRPEHDMPAPSARQGERYIMGTEREPLRAVPSTSNVAAPVAGFLDGVGIWATDRLTTTACDPSSRPFRRAALAYHAQAVCSRSGFGCYASAKQSFLLIGTPWAKLAIDQSFVAGANDSLAQQLVPQSSVSTVRSANDLLIHAFVLGLNDGARLRAHDGLDLADPRPFLPRNIEVYNREAGPSGVRARTLASAGLEERQVSASNADSFAVRAIEVICDTERSRRMIVETINRNSN